MLSKRGSLLPPPVAPGTARYCPVLPGAARYCPVLPSTSYISKAFSQTSSLMELVNVADRLVHRGKILTDACVCVGTEVEVSLLVVRPMRTGFTLGLLVGLSWFRGSPSPRPPLPGGAVASHALRTFPQ